MRDTPERTRALVKLGWGRCHHTNVMRIEVERRTGVIEFNILSLGDMSRKAALEEARCAAESANVADDRCVARVRHSWCATAVEPIPR